jgi:hypothetical protein
MRGTPTTGDERLTIPIIIIMMQIKYNAPFINPIELISFLSKL